MKTEWYCEFCDKYVNPHECEQEHFIDDWSGDLICVNMVGEPIQSTRESRND